MTRGALTIVVLVALAGVRPCSGQDLQQKGVGRFARWTFEDPITWLSTWNPQRLLHVGLYGAALVPISGMDEDLDIVVSNWNTGPILDAANDLGSYYGMAGAVGIFAVSLVTPNTKFQDAAFTSIESILYAGLVTFGIKYTVGRARPEANLGAFNFEPFSGNYSFPSGHTTTAFAMLTTWTFYYPSIWTYGLFGVASATGLARMVKRKHWFTDVLGGAGVGTATAFWLSRRHQGLQDHFTAIPIIAPGLLAVSVTLQLDR